MNNVQTGRPMSRNRKPCQQYGQYSRNCLWIRIIWHLTDVKITVTSIGIHVRLKLFAQTVVEILRKRAMLKCLIKFKGQRSRSRPKAEITVGIHVRSLKLLAKTILEILKEWSIFICFMNHVTLKLPLTFTFKLDLNTKISLISGKT